MRIRALAKLQTRGEPSHPTAAAYTHFAPYVRRRLAGLGVRDCDLPDLCHEVFLIVHRKVHLLRDVERVALWLRAICRRVAAGYRRRFGHRLEILRSDPELEGRDEDALFATRAGVPRLDSMDTPDGPDVVAERREQLALVRRALNRLDDESRDLLALHHLAQMPITELAQLFAHDRKTIRKRLLAARRRVSRLVGRESTLDGRASAP